MFTRSVETAAGVGYLPHIHARGPALRGIQARFDIRDIPRPSMLEAP
jgi:hypothetical protein